jgi:Conjugal transfer protein TrbL
MGGAGSLPGDLQQLIEAIKSLTGLLSPLLHPNLVAALLLKDSLGLLLKVWFDFVLSTTDLDTTKDFTQNAVIRMFEPVVQGVADSLLVLVVIWASYRIMWGHGVRSQFTARVLLPRLFMGAVLINFSQPMFQAVVVVSNTLCDVVQKFGTIPDWSVWWATFSLSPGDGLWQVFTTAVLVVGYDVLAVAYLVRYTVLIFLAISAPLAGLLFVLPDTNHVAKTWRKLFVTNLFMQPVQLFVMAIGFALESAGHTPVRHLFALASLLVVFKVPGAMGSAEKIAHRIEAAVHSGLTHLEHAVVQAV